MNVYDSSTLLAYINNESGAEFVGGLLDNADVPQYIHAVNLLEVLLAHVCCVCGRMNSPQERREVRLRGLGRSYSLALAVLTKSWNFDSPRRRTSRRSCGEFIRPAYMCLLYSAKQANNPQSCSESAVTYGIFNVSPRQ